MPLLSLFCQIPVSDSEITFLKFLGILVLCLWVCYLLKELLWHPQAPPPLDVVALTKGIGEQMANAVTSIMHSQVATMDARMAEQMNTIVERFNNVSDTSQRTIQKLAEDVALMKGKMFSHHYGSHERID